MLSDLAVTHRFLREGFQIVDVGEASFSASSRLIWTWSGTKLHEWFVGLTRLHLLSAKICDRGTHGAALTDCNFPGATGTDGL